MNTVASPETPFLRASPDLQRLPPLARNDRVRLVKDVLRVGKWYSGDDAAGNPLYREWDEAALERLAARFQEHQHAGITHPLCMGHRPPLRDDVQEDQSVADLAHLWTENGTLYFGVYVTEERAKELTEKHRQCSVGLLADWTDGTGKLWEGYSLMHVGIVPHAVVPGQLPFIEMAARPKGKRMTFDVIKSVLNLLLEAVKPGTALPEAVSEENFDEMVPALIELIVGKEPETPDEPEVPEVPLVPPVDGPVEMSAFMQSIKDEFAALRKELLGDKVAQAETEFRDRIAELGTAGVPAAALTKAVEMGAKLGWDQSVIEMVANAGGKRIEMGSQVKSHRKSAPASPHQPTPEDLEEAKAALAGKLANGGRKSK